MTQQDFNNYMIEKYGSEANALKTKHWETKEVKDSKGKIFIPEGKIVDSTFSFTFRDTGTGSMVTVGSGMIKEITYRVYEEKLQDDRRNINILKPRYLAEVIDNIETVLDYEPSSEYINPKLKKGSNPNLG